MTPSTAPRQIRVAILVDNEAGAGLESEHGFSVWIDTGDRHLLFDTGKTDLLLTNAERLNIDLDMVDTVVLSHGHYDHTGGLAPLLHACRSCDIYCHPAAVSPRYSIRNHKVKQLQMPADSKTALEHLPQEHMHWVEQPMQITPDIGLTGPILRHTGFEDTGGPFYLDKEGRRPDPIDDDLALWVRSEKGILVFVGCAHAGLINTLDQIRQQNPGEEIQAVIGGFHLAHADQMRQERTIRALQQLNPPCIIPCHCTGEEMVEKLRYTFGRQCHRGMAGMQLKFNGNGMGTA